ncbi:helix-turn-helix domain-containing protein [Pararhizobium haloflavum]|uniref:helix-turn-helix domain-containing protein n=1 Tax=Pararhizobium haloflavum TaxID=2037914 RepID=UPI000C19481C|nr:helix-turn-helix transcriptional regulator [Pararhizobium haloflavum]
MYGHPQHGMDTDEVTRLRHLGGRWLRILRENANLSQRGLADQVGIEYYSFISQIETGRGRIPPERYVAFAKAFKIDPQIFVRELMRYYDPLTHELLFGEEDGQDKTQR